MPLPVLTIVILVFTVGYLIYRLRKASKEKIILLITHVNHDTEWIIFDSMVEAKAYIRLDNKENARYSTIRTDKRVPKNWFDIVKPPNVL